SRVRQQHGVAEVPSGARIREHGGDEDPLIDLQSLLVALQEGGLGRNLGARRNQPRHEHRGVVYKLIDADEARAFLREPVVDRPGMGGEKAAARVACCFLHSLGLLRLLRVARGLRGQARKPRRTALPESRVARAVAGKIASALRRCFSSGCFRERQVFGRLSITRTALPCERCTVPGSTTRTLVLTPMVPLMLRSRSCSTAVLAAAGVSTRRSTSTSRSSRCPSRRTSST